MKDLRKNEFIDMLEMAEILFEDKGNFIQCDIPNIGNITYYPKANKFQIHHNNSWVEEGFEFINNYLWTISKKDITDENILRAKNIYQSSFHSEKKPNVIKVNPMRDDFAKSVLQAMISNSGIGDLLKLTGAKTMEESDKILAITSYRIADAMIKQREL